MSQLVEQDPERVAYLSALGGVFHNMAMVAMQSDDYSCAESFVKEAIKYQEKARSKNPDDSQVIVFLRNHNVQWARILRDTNRPMEAVEAYSKALDFAERAIEISGSTSSRGYALWVMCELSRFLADPSSGPARDLARSIELAEKAHEIDPESNTPLYTLGVIAFHTGDWDRAIELLPAIVADEEFDLDLQGFAAVYVATAYAQKGDVQLANDSLHKAREIIEKIDSAKDKDKLNALVHDAESLLQSQPPSTPPDKS